MAEANTHGTRDLRDLWKMCSGEALGTRERQRGYQKL